MKKPSQERTGKKKKIKDKVRKAARNQNISGRGPQSESSQGFLLPVVSNEHKPVIHRRLQYQKIVWTPGRQDWILVQVRKLPGGIGLQCTSVLNLKAKRAVSAMVNHDTSLRLAKHIPGHACKGKSALTPHPKD